MPLLRQQDGDNIILLGLFWAFRKCPVYPRGSDGSLNFSRMHFFKHEMATNVPPGIVTVSGGAECEEREECRHAIAKAN